MHLLTAKTNDNVIRLQYSGSRTTFHNLSNQYTFFHSKFIGLLLHFLCQSFVHLQVRAQCSTGDAQQSALHCTKLFQVSHNFCHDAGGNCETVTGIGPCRWIEHSIDAYQFTSRINQCTTTVTLIDGSIRLNERLDICSLSIGCSSADGTSFRAHNTGCNGGVQVERITYRQYPFANFQFVGIAYRYCGEIITFYFNQGKVRTRVGTDDPSFQFAVVIQLYGNLIGAFNHVIVGHDITVFRNNHTGAKAYTRLGLYLTLLSAAITEEEIKNIRHALYGLSLAQLLSAYMYHSMNRILCRLCQIDRLRIRCIISSQL